MKKMVEMFKIKLHRGNGIDLVIFAFLAAILCLMLSVGDRIGIVTNNGYINCTEILLEIEPGVFSNICSDFLNPDLQQGE